MAFKVRPLRLGMWALVLWLMVLEPRDRRLTVARISQYLAHQATSAVAEVEAWAKHLADSPESTPDVMHNKGV